MNEFLMSITSLWVHFKSLFVGWFSWIHVDVAVRKKIVVKVIRFSVHMIVQRWRTFGQLLG